MESVKSGKKNFITKTWKRCRSFPRNRRTGGAGGGLVKSKSWNGKEMNTKTKKITSEGFFPVYVGPEKRRFAIKMKYVNHPLFLESGGGGGVYLEVEQRDGMPEVERWRQGRRWGFCRRRRV
ncbi:hypothetical protein SSX86_022791 [Deinandra increscens subsp. villosa]|uniref:Uncharacterized protein n=1 Tax=Deinandra increscens subsp. villosa TaxID=3103831 RepID=A0AAP0CPV4_9ASTR